jgi:starvation-inducible DNA-binding protein
MSTETARLVPQSPLARQRRRQLYATSDAISECLRNMGANHYARGRCDLRPSNSESADMDDSECGLDRLRIENQILTGSLRTAQALCLHDIVTSSLIDVWIDEARRRAWILFDATRDD